MTISATSCVRSKYLALRRAILLCMTKLISVTLRLHLLRHRHILKPVVGAQMKCDEFQGVIHHFGVVE
jgi:hypothetical protein